MVASVRPFFGALDSWDVGGELDKDRDSIESLARSLPEDASNIIDQISVKIDCGRMVAPSGIVPAISVRELSTCVRD
ncbi:hypothetical protein ACJ72_02826 [Emergomyces africanus]|uniref:Uncharacterized protein n=1 Tax=Emergomyces africanus TaxID=1955775 RepID=A0A1B7P1B7_9EURO|nr:hypothetical protein ACJ72_02826 [Emergomyces africanus]